MSSPFDARRWYTEPGGIELSCPSVFDRAQEANFRGEQPLLPHRRQLGSGCAAVRCRRDQLGRSGHGIPGCESIRSGGKRLPMPERIAERVAYRSERREV